jgi:dienelactone hydrolase
MRIFVTLLSLFCINYCIAVAQKPPLDSSVYSKWPALGYPKLSPDGRFVAYGVDNQPIGSSTLMIVATNGKWKKEYIGVSQAEFVNTSVLLFRRSDTLYIQKLGTEGATYIPDVTSYVVAGDSNPWIAYQKKNDLQQVVVANLSSGKELTISKVNSFQFSRQSNFLVFQVAEQEGVELQIMDLKSMALRTIWRGTSLGFVVFDRYDTQIAFLASLTERNDALSNAYWYYKIGNDTASLLLDNHTKSLDDGFGLGDMLGFSDRGNRLFFSSISRFSPEVNTDFIPLNIWSYKDVKLQRQQLEEIGPKRYLYSVDIHTKRVVKLQEENEHIINLIGNDDHYKDEYVILLSNNGGDASETWFPGSKMSKYLLSTIDGTKLKLPGDGHNNGSISPENKFYVYYDFKKNNYFSYEIASGKHSNITKGINASWVSKYNVTDTLGLLFPIAGWLKGDSAVLLHDTYDIWQVDLKGESAAIELTQGVGKKEHIFFERIVESPLPAQQGEKIILASFDKDSKENGFYSATIGKKSSLKELSTGQYYQYARLGATRNFDGIIFEPIKARNTDAYIVRRMRDREAPNYYFTRDFQTFNPVSSVHPEKNYNWYSTELHEWSSVYHSHIQGLLYKPENFDPKKKYPVIFNYYEIRSDMLNAYIAPSPSYGDLNIPLYVSNGYLVFTPDIYYELGDPFEKGTYDCVVSAAKYVSKLPFVDSSRMGICGLSWGGIQTNYLVTHTNMFAAACSGSSVSDFVSAYNGLAHGNGGAQPIFEEGQNRVGFSVWDNPNWYIRNSPIMSADKVTTPLLLFQTTNDLATRIEQAIEFFNALRRLGKKVWLLEYTDGNHGVWGKSGLDFDLRLQQFFNYYLKDALPPKWMTRGRAANLRKIDAELNLDSSGINP